MVTPAHTNPYEGLDTSPVLGANGEVIGHRVNVPEGDPQVYISPFDLGTSAHNAVAAEAVAGLLGIPTAEESGAIAADLAEPAADMRDRFNKL